MSEKSVAQRWAEFAEANGVWCQDGEEWAALRQVPDPNDDLGLGVALDVLAVRAYTSGHDEMVRVVSLCTGEQWQGYVTRPDGVRSHNILGCDAMQPMLERVMQTVAYGTLD